LQNQEMKFMQHKIFVDDLWKNHIL